MGPTSSVEASTRRRRVSAEQRARDRLRAPLTQLGRPPAWLALGALLLLTAAFLYYETRGTTLWFDEWEWALHRRGNDLDTFLRPHNQHLSLVPIAIYRLLFATAGLGDYAPYRMVVIAVHLVCGALVFVYASRRVGAFVGLLAAGLILLLGPAWQNIIWPFQVGWLISLAAGVGALLMLDRGDRVGDAVACALLVLSLACSGLGVVLALGVGVDVLWGRRRWRDAWIVALPLALFAVWWLVYSDARTTRHAILAAPSFVAAAAAAAISALAGLSGQTIPDTGQPLGWGRPLAVAAVAVLVWRLARLRPVPPRVVTLLALLLSFWTLTALSRAGLDHPWASRYVYVGGLFGVLLAVEVARGISLGGRARLLLAAAVAIAMVSNLGAFRDAGGFMRGQAQLATADLGVLEIGRPVVDPRYVLRDFPGAPLVKVAAGPYFAAARAYGSPAASPARIAVMPEPVRRAADAELIGIHGIALRSARMAAAGRARPTPERVAGGLVRARAGCLAFRRIARAGASVPATLELVVPPAGLRLRAAAGPATLRLRRFAAGFPAGPQATLSPSVPAVLRIARDRARRPWQLRVSPAAGVTVCGLG